MNRSLNVSSSQRVIEGLWYLFAALMPLFSVSFFRFDLGIYHFTPAAFVVPVIGLVHLIWYPGSCDLIRRQVKVNRWLVYGLSFLVLAHAFSLFGSNDLRFGIKEFCKLVLALGNFAIIYIFFPRSLKVTQRFFNILLLSDALLIALLALWYAFYFKAPYLGTSFFSDTVTGKNHLGWFAAVVLPYALVLLFRSGSLIKSTVINVILFVGLLYTMSRSSWIASVIMIFWISFAAMRCRHKLNFKAFFVFVVATSICAGIIVKQVDLVSDLGVRFQSIYNPTALPVNDQTLRLGKNSYSRRTHLMQLTLNKFIEKPFLGNGLADAGHWGIGTDAQAHNDYLTVLFETGLIGGVPFFVVLCLIGKRVLVKKKDAIQWAGQASFIGVMVLSNFIDMYTSVHYWVFVSLSLVVATRVGSSDVSPSLATCAES